ncbi:Transcription factor [Metarhizium rileyi]|uniref:Transcription factor n=1 Tax=Metarhizium rileyi (strain RCEF 4871) TaxID=1649241 RepID=A0A166VV12_METRR|nr:Transcription factor [Metarhizium rileyi RCEF 4871]
MASLRNIMNVDTDDDQASSHSLKNAMNTTSRSSQHSDVTMAATSYNRDLDYSMNTSPSRVRRLSPPIRSSYSVPVDHQPSSMSYGDYPDSRHLHDRRQSNASADSMDSQYGQGQVYGHGNSGSFSTTPMRPFVPPQEVPVKLTPITGRTFTRAEHLRRHQLSHQPPALPCTIPGCDKVFHRRDLLERHQQRHDQDDRVGKSNQPPNRSHSQGDGRRLPSYPSSPQGSLIQVQQPYSSASPTPLSTAPTPTLSMHPSPWASHSAKPTTVAVRHTPDDITLGGIKTEYLEPVPNLPTTTATAFAEPRTMPTLPTVEGSSSICVSTIPTTSLTWSASPRMAAPLTTSHGGAFSTPAELSQSSSRSSVGVSSGPWTPRLDQPTSRGMPPSVMATGGYVAYGYSPSVPQAYAPMYDDEPTVGIPGYGETPGLYGSHVPTSSMRMSPQLVVGQSSETMVTTAAALPPGRVVNPLPWPLERTSRLGLLAQEMMPVSLSREARSALPNYIDIFWEKVHPLYPIIHKSTVEDGAAVIPEHMDVLRCAMAALATQFLGHREHRVNGSLLHSYAWNRSKTFTQSTTWSLPTMQTVLLCEYYARFRGRHKDDYQPSSRFLTLCQMVSGYCSATVSQSSGGDTERWNAWIYMESCRRLLAACFLLSVHGMCYHEQPYSTVLGVDELNTSKFHIALSGSTTNLWEARNAEAWAAIDPSTIVLTTIEDLIKNPTMAAAESTPAFDVSLAIATQALQLPTRQNRQEVDLDQDVSSFHSNDLHMSKYFGRRPGANTYLALHYTPLHVLLAVSGDSWIFNKKIPDASLFAEHKRKLGQWRDSGTSAVATVFAARAIRDFLDLSGRSAQSLAPPSTPHGAMTCTEISDYWGLYVCTLICWAFGHVGKRTTTDKRLPARSRAISWVRTVAELEPGRLQALPKGEDSQAIVGFVRDILEKDCLGGRNILFADSVGVLRKLEEVDNWRWF